MPTLSRVARALASMLCLVACHPGSEPSGPAWSGDTTSSAGETGSETSAAIVETSSTSDDTSPFDTSTGIVTTSGESSSSDDAGQPGIDCSSIAHVGDSLTASTVRALTSAYAAVGVDAQIDAFGGRAILQNLPEDPHTGEEAAESIVASGFVGCWVVALGTNDTANVDAGAGYSRDEAIDAMMTAIDATAAAPVMWVDTFTTNASGYWANDNMILWNEALVAATTRWANLTVYEWSAVAATGVAPYSDGIHHTSAGYDVRNAHIAQALVDFFPLP